MKNPLSAFSSRFGNGIPLLSIIAFFFFSLFFADNSDAQTANSLAEYEDQVTIEYMKANGATDASIAKWIKDRKEALSADYHNSNYANPSKKNPKVSAVGTCADMGGENGWGAWEAATGFTYYPQGGTNITTTGLNPASLPLRFGLNTSGTNSCTPGPTGPAVPLVAPGFGNTSIQLGQTGANGNMNTPTCNSGPHGGCAERLTYDLLVTPADTNFTYAYAVILENPCAPSFNKHSAKQTPFAEIYMLDQNNDTVQCSYHKYMGDTMGNCKPTAASGMFAASCNGPGGNDVAYQPWTVVTLNLGAYVGQVVKVIITNGDCGLSVHYCYSYWDFQCSPPAASPIPFCVGQQTTINGPISPGSTYTWYQNHSLYTGPPSATSQNITPTPAIGDTFVVGVQLNSGCKYYMSFVPQASMVTPAFSFAPACGQVTFTDNSTVTPASPTNTVVAWNWQFPGGSPASASSKNPGVVLYPPGTYTVTLIVTSNAGCVDTVKHSFTVGGLLPAMSQQNILCGVGGTASVAVSGGSPGYTYVWSHGATTSAVSNLTAGNYTVTVIDAAGCSGSNTLTITSAANITAVAPSTTVCAGQNTVLTASGGTNYSWSNGATTASISLTPMSSATYTVIVSSGACVDTAYASVAVTPSPSLNLGNDSILCVLQTVTLDAGSTGASSYLWSTGESTQTISVTGPGTYWVIASLNNCLAKDTVSLMVAPTVDLSDSSLCTITPIVLTAGAGATSYLWSTGEVTQSISVETAGNYWVEVMYGSCRSADTAVITGDGLGGSLYVPNAFTPNEDQLNEVFLARGTGITSFDMSVFDRWGNRIFSSNDINKGWDGKIDGGHYLLKNDGDKTAQQDVYVWKINYTTQCFPTLVEREMGHVSLIK